MKATVIGDPTKRIESVKPEILAAFKEQRTMPETDTTNMINALNTAAPTGKPLAEIYQDAESASTGRGRPSTVSSRPEP